ncbi:MAG: S-adenosylmethionine:tRNA ribosyltransferase-isomerase [Mucinivorans sp.]
MINSINISDFDYPLTSERIAKFPLERRDQSKLLIYKDNQISHTVFSNLFYFLPSDTLLVFNNTKVVRARLIFHKATGARIEVFCLEPDLPRSYEQAFAATRHCSWHCIVGNAKKWKGEPLLIGDVLRATKGSGDEVNFEWTTDETFGQLLERLGRTPIPPYLERESEAIDTVRYQTTYARYEGSVAAPTAGLHFSEQMLSKVPLRADVTLHVGAGTFLPVKVENAADHHMHVESFDVQIDELRTIAAHQGRIIAVGTTSVRTLESLAVLAGRVATTGEASPDKTVGQWERYQECPLELLVEWMECHGVEKLYSSTQIMITPGYEFRTLRGMITNFHQPHSTLLLLISALVGPRWRDIYDYALNNDFRFLSYGDSSLLLRNDHESV